jgi:cation transport regulator
MPYATTDELPPAVRRLPPHAQEIFLSAFNSAWDSYGREDTAFRVAWAAVKKRYRKVGDDWVAKTRWEPFG